MSQDQPNSSNQYDTHQMVSEVSGATEQLIITNRVENTTFPVEMDTTTTTSTTSTTTTNIYQGPIRKFPYSLSSLQWDEDHLENKESTYCYCGKDKAKIMISCDLCKQKFHLQCIRLLEGSLQLYGDWVYRFSCSVCAGIESFERFSKNWVDILEITLFNLQDQKHQQAMGLFDDMTGIESSSISKRSLSSSSSSISSLNNNNNNNNSGSLGNSPPIQSPKFDRLNSIMDPDDPRFLYFSFDQEIVPFVEINWNLLCSDKKKKLHWQKQLSQALTNGRIFKSGLINWNMNGYWALGTDQLLLKDNTVFKDKVLAPIHNKKKKKKKSSQEEERDKYLTKLLLIPNKDTLFVPTIEYDIMCVAKENSAPQIKIGPDQLTVSNEKGYRMARASYPCICGDWYFEIDIVDDIGNSRLGWSTSRGDIQANVGYDQYSYAYRNSQGDIFTNARSKPYGEPFGKGDTIGFFIHLPITQSTKPNEINFPFINQLQVYDLVSSEMPPIALPGEETPPSPPPSTTTKPLEIIDGSFIMFFKNGDSPGPAFTNIGKGMYYPAASLYMGATVKFNFGPTFKYPPKDISYKPYCDLKEK